jgi:predicted NBD/HSP70 family sugar kinase
MKISNTHSIKSENTKLVIEKLIELKETTRIELSRVTGLNKATISTIMADLALKDIVVETNRIVKTSGRSAIIYALNKNAGRIISIELLYESVYGVVTNLYGTILYEVTMPVSSVEFQTYLKTLMETIDELKRNTYDSTYGLIGIGIGVYGILSKQKKIKFATFNSWKDIDLKSIIEEYTGIETYVENEANISALGEHLVFTHDENLISLNIGAGVGMGIIIDNKLYTGENGYAGEIGHTIVVPNGKRCVCGNYGCLEKYIAEPAIIEQYESLTKQKITIDEFIHRYKDHEPNAIKTYTEFIDFLSIGINNVSLMFNPKTIVINSKIVESIPETISLVKNKFRSQIMTLELLTLSKYRSKTNVLGLTHVLIQKFLNVENYRVFYNSTVK